MIEIYKANGYKSITDLYHSIPHKIILKTLQLKLKDRRKVNEKNTFPSILKKNQKILVSKKVLKRELEAEAKKIILQKI